MPTPNKRRFVVFLWTILLLPAAPLAAEILWRGEAVIQQALVNQTELLRRENMMAEIEIVAFVIDKLERQHEGYGTSVRDRG